jgi:hypothetical protein
LLEKEYTGPARLPSGAEIGKPVIKSALLTESRVVLSKVGWISVSGDTLRLMVVAASAFIQKQIIYSVAQARLTLLISTYMMDLALGQLARTLCVSRSPRLLLQILQDVDDTKPNSHMHVAVMKLLARVLRHELCNANHVVILGRIVDECKRVLRDTYSAREMATHLRAQVSTTDVCAVGACCVENPRIHSCSP